MSEEQQIDPTPTVEVEAPTPAQETDWKAMARKWEAQAKANAAAAKKLADLEEAAKTDEQKRAEQVQRLESELNQYKLREQQASWASEIVAGSSIPAAVLRGDSREEMEKHFQSLHTLIPEPAQQQRVVIPREGANTPIALNSNALEEALRAAVGAK